MCETSGKARTYDYSNAHASTANPRENATSYSPDISNLSLAHSLAQTWLGSLVLGAISPHVRRRARRCAPSTQELWRRLETGGSSLAVELAQSPFA
jgi:hypothetical protein